MSIPLPGRREDGLTIPAATAAKYKKTPVFEGTFARFPLALAEIAKVSVFGAEKHQNAPGDRSFVNVPNAASVYLNAESRHILQEVMEGPVNKADGDLFHKAQKAWNALADLEVFLVNHAVYQNGVTVTGAVKIRPATEGPKATKTPKESFADAQVREIVTVPELV